MEHSIIDYIIHNDELHESFRETAEYKRVSDKRFEVYEKLREALNDEQRKMFDKFEELETEERCIKVEMYFKVGVKVGARFLAESMFD